MTKQRALSKQEGKESMWVSILIVALGTFAIGTDSFVTSGILPTIAQDLHITVACAGQMGTVFAVAYLLTLHLNARKY